MRFLSILMSELAKKYMGSLFPSQRLWIASMPINVALTTFMLSRPKLTSHNGRPQINSEG